MNGLSVRFRAREFYKEVSYVFAAAFVDEGDVWSLSHVALALSGLGLLGAICTFALCMGASPRTGTPQEPGQRCRVGMGGRHGEQGRG
jgi:hypothetical protein